MLVGGHQVERVSFHVTVDSASQINDQADSGSHPQQQDSNQTGNDSAADFEDGRPCMMYIRKSCYCKCAFSVILEYPKYTPLFKIRFMGELFPGNTRGFTWILLLLLITIFTDGITVHRCRWCCRFVIYQPINVCEYFSDKSSLSI